MKRFSRLFLLLLFVTIFAGAIPAYAAGTGYNGESGHYTDFDYSYYDHRFTMEAPSSESFKWPSSGNVLLSTTTDYKSVITKCVELLNGTVIPTGLTVDVYWLNNITNSYTLLEHYDTTDGSSCTISITNTFSGSRSSGTGTGMAPYNGDDFDIVGKTLMKYLGSDKNVVIPDGVTEIGLNAFTDCETVESITIPGSVKTIHRSIRSSGIFPSGGFALCPNLKEVIILDGVETISEDAFSNCQNLERVVLPDSVVTIESCAFNYCKKLKSVTFSKNLKKIDSQAFYHCESLTDLVLPEGLESIGIYAFSNCINLETLTLPDSLTELGSWAFDWCKGLKTVVVGDNLTKIDREAFATCTQLTDVTLGKNLKVLGPGVFYGCTSLERITLPECLNILGGDEITNYGGIFEGCTALKSIVIPESVTTIGANAFNGCTALESVVIGSNVKEMCNAVFSGCTSLKSIDLPASVSTIRAMAFGNCTNLEQVILRNGVTTIWSSAFYKDINLKAVYIPASVTNFVETYTSADDILKNCPNVVIYGEAGSTAQSYARKVGVPFVTAEPPAWTGANSTSAVEKDVVVPTSQTLTVNGENVSGAEIYNINGSNYFKLRDIAALLTGTGSQFSIDYDASARLITVTTGAAYAPDGSELAAGTDKSATAVRSAQSLKIDGTSSSLTAFNIGGNNYFGLRDLGQTLGFNVDYDAATKTMIVISK